MVFSDSRRRPPCSRISTMAGPGLPVPSGQRVRSAKQIAGGGGRTSESASLGARPQRLDQMGVQGGCVGISLIIRPTEIAGCSFHRHPSKPAPSGLNRCGGPVPRVAAARRTLGYERMSLQDMAWMDVVRGRKAEWNLLSLEVFGRCMLFGFPLAQFFTIQTQRSGHRGPPPRHPVGGSIRTVVFGWVSSGGLGRSRFCEARWIVVRPTQVQRGRIRTSLGTVKSIHVCDLEMAVLRRG